MHVTSTITVTISATQELCKYAPKLSYVRSILHEAQNKKKIRGFSFPSFILMSILYHNVTPVRRESASVSQRSFGNKTACITGIKLHQISIQSVKERSVIHPLSKQSQLNRYSGFPSTSTQMCEQFIKLAILTD